jgi:phage-related baseplate assembly protein
MRTNLKNNRDMADFIWNDIVVSIDDRRLHGFRSLNLHQPVGDHHSFELTLDPDTVGKRYVEGFTDGTEWLGKRMLVHANGDDTAVFLGVVSKVCIRKESLDGGTLLVCGHSTTYLLENGPSFRSWLGRTLEEIVGELCAKAGVGLMANPENRLRLDYVCQYDESDFTFIRRLAHNYHEWLYYDGTRLVFGKPKRPDAVGLELDRDVTGFEAGVQTLARPATVFSYLPAHDLRMVENTPDRPAGLDLPGYRAFMASMGMFKVPALQYARSRVHHMKEMEMYVRGKQAAETADSHYVKGRIRGRWLSVGSVVKISSPFGKRIGSLAEASMGEYLVVEVWHGVGEDGSYVGRFKAIPAVAHCLPMEDPGRPVAETQMAMVVGNENPQRMGCVQVRMNWQSDGMRTDWIGVMTPDGGGGEGGSKGRGHLFMPEVGDLVLVGFRLGDPNRPYVMGSLYNASTGIGVGEGNRDKSISTRSGIRIAFNDESRSLSITDPSGNMVLMDGKGHVRIDAPNGLVLNAGHIEMNTGGDMTLNVGNGFMASVGGNWTTSVGSAMDTMANDYRTTVVNGLEMRSASALLSTDTNMQLQGETVNAIGTKRLLMHSDEQVLANSRGRMDMKSDGSLNMEQKADDVKKEEKERMALATVEFRPDAAYNGEFGFDWLRVKGDPVPKQVQDKGSGGSSQPRSGNNGKSGKSDEPARPVETSYKDIILGGFCDGKRNLTKDEAYERLKKEYRQVPVTFRKGEGSTYFVPYLNLYSEECVKEMSDLEGVPKPCYKATLRVLVDINEEVDRLEFDYDKDIFEIDRPTLTDKEKTQGKTESKDKTIEITCKKSFGDENRGVIRVFAYPKGCADKPMAEQVRLRSLAGKIMVGVNDEQAQKNMKFVLVRVKTIINSNVVAGDFTPEHLELLSNTLHQMYINPMFEQYAEEKEGENPLISCSKQDPMVLDLTQGPYAEGFAKYMDDDKIAKKPIIRNPENEEDIPFQRQLDENLANFLRTAFLQQYPQYENSFTIFSFVNDEVEGLPGFCEVAADVKTMKFSHFKQNVVLFGNRKSTTLSHEALHGLGLFHTHFDEKVIEEKEKKYVFIKDTTDNIMSYADSRKTTCHWQWEIVRDKNK